MSFSKEIKQHLPIWATIQRLQGTINASELVVFPLLLKQMSKRSHFSHNASWIVFSVRLQCGTQGTSRDGEDAEDHSTSAEGSFLRYIRIIAMLWHCFCRLHVWFGELRGSLPVRLPFFARVAQIRPTNLTLAHSVCHQFRRDSSRVRFVNQSAKLQVAAWFGHLFSRWGQFRWSGFFFRRSLRKSEAESFHRPCMLQFPETFGNLFGYRRVEFGATSVPMRSEDVRG